MAFLANLFRTSPEEELVNKATDELLISHDWAANLEIADVVNNAADEAVAAEVRAEVEKLRRSDEMRAEAARLRAEEAARLQPDWPKAWARKGKALACLQRHKLAASSYARGLECALTLLQKNDERHARELEALRKQAKTASDSYMALLGETETLKRQLEDYTLMFGERETGGKAKGQRRQDFCGQFHTGFPFSFPASWRAVNETLPQEFSSGKRAKPTLSKRIFVVSPQG